MLTKNLIVNLTTKMFLVASLAFTMVGCGDDVLMLSPDTVATSANNTLEKNDSFPGQIVVKFKQTMTAESMAAFASQVNSRALKVSTRLNTAVIQVQNGEETPGFIEILNNNPQVEYAEPHYKFGISYTVSDPKSREQNGLAIAGLAKAWDITFGDPKVVIAVIDTGADLNHPDLKDKFVPGYNVISMGKTPPMDDNGHGTHVSGIAAASTNNKVGIAGACPNCKIMPVKVLNGAGSGEGSENGSFNVALGVFWAVDHGARIINMSLGGPDGKTLRRAVDYALKKNVVIISAMGNDGKNIRAYPAALPGVISVGSVDFDKSKSSFSNYGTWISIAAPGDQILSTLPTYDVTMTRDGLDSKYKSYDYLSGTSMATPMVAGIVGLVLSRNPQYTPAEVKQRLESTASDLGKAGFDPEYGHGLINAAKAVL